MVFSIYLSIIGEDIGKQSEELLLAGLSLAQKYIVLLTIIVLIICAIFRHLAKIKKNTRVQNYFLTLGIGMFFLCILFTFLPYIVLNNME